MALSAALLVLGWTLASEPNIEPEKRVGYGDYQLVKISAD